jgi:predicted nucleic acid-binding protein
MLPAGTSQHTMTDDFDRSQSSIVEASSTRRVRINAPSDASPLDEEAVPAQRRRPRNSRLQVFPSRAQQRVSPDRAREPVARPDIFESQESDGPPPFSASLHEIQRPSQSSPEEERDTDRVRQQRAPTICVPPTVGRQQSVGAAVYQASTVRDDEEEDSQNTKATDIHATAATHNGASTQATQCQEPTVTADAEMPEILDASGAQSTVVQRITANDVVRHASLSSDYGATPLESQPPARDDNIPPTSSLSPQRLKAKATPRRSRPLQNPPAFPLHPGPSPEQHDEDHHSLETGTGVTSSAGSQKRVSRALRQLQPFLNPGMREQGEEAGSRSGRRRQARRSSEDDLDQAIRDSIARDASLSDESDPPPSRAQKRPRSNDHLPSAKRSAASGDDSIALQFACSQDVALLEPSDLDDSRVVSPSEPVTTAERDTTFLRPLAAPSDPWERRLRLAEPSLTAIVHAVAGDAKPLAGYTIILSGFARHSTALPGSADRDTALRAGTRMEVLMGASRSKEASLEQRLGVAPSGGWERPSGPLTVSLQRLLAPCGMPHAFCHVMVGLVGSDAVSLAALVAHRTLASLSKDLHSPRFAPALPPALTDPSLDDVSTALIHLGATIVAESFLAEHNARDASFKAAQFDQHSPLVTVVRNRAVRSAKAVAALARGAAIVGPSWIAATAIARRAVLWHAFSPYARGVELGSVDVGGWEAVSPSWPLASGVSVDGVPRMDVGGPVACEASELEDDVPSDAVSLMGRPPSARALAGASLFAVSEAGWMSFVGMAGGRVEVVQPCTEQRLRDFLRDAASNPLGCVAQAKALWGKVATSNVLAELERTNTLKVHREWWSKVVSLADHCRVTRRLLDAAGMVVVSDSASEAWECLSLWGLGCWCHFLAETVTDCALGVEVRDAAHPLTVADETGQFVSPLAVPDSLSDENASLWTESLMPRPLLREWVFAAVQDATVPMTQAFQVGPKRLRVVAHVGVPAPMSPRPASLLVGPHVSAASLADDVALCVVASVSDTPPTTAPALLQQSVSRVLPKRVAHFRLPTECRSWVVTKGARLFSGVLVREGLFRAGQLCTVRVPTAWVGAAFRCGRDATGWDGRVARDDASCLVVARVEVVVQHESRVMVVLRLVAAEERLSGFGLVRDAVAFWADVDCLCSTVTLASDDGVSDVLRWCESRHAGALSSSSGALLRWLESHAGAIDLASLTQSLRRDVSLSHAVASPLSLTPS